MYNFDEIVGNEKIIKNLKNAIKNKTQAHFYIIDGREKSGKELIAKTFSKALLCEDEENKPCNKCSSCITFDTGNNPDFFFIDSDKKNIGVSEIRENIIKNISTKPFKYNYKIFVIKNAHTMTIQAQNAILKTVEEPPSFAIFIMLSQNYNSFLSTIISRSILLKIKPLPQNIIAKYLLDMGINQTLVDFYSVYSSGSIGKALDIVNDENVIRRRNDVLSDIEKLDYIDLIQMYKLIEKYEEKKEDIENILDIYLLTYRDSLIFKNTHSFDKVIQKDIDTIIKDIANMSVKNLINKIEAILKTKLYLKQNANFSMSIESLFLKLKEKDND